MFLIQITMFRVFLALIFLIKLKARLIFSAPKQSFVHQLRQNVHVFLAFTQTTSNLS